MLNLAEILVGLLCYLWQQCLGLHIPQQVFRGGAHFRHKGQSSDHTTATSTRQRARNMPPLNELRACTPIVEKRNTHGRRSFLDFVAAAGLAGGVAVLSPEDGAAFCGEQFPSWAYEVEFEEGVIPFAYGDFKGDLYIRQIGSEKKEKKANMRPLVLFPTAGLTHDYLSTVEAVVQKNHRVITFDPIGCGTSAPLPEDEEGGVDNKERRATLLSPACLQAQADTLLEHLEIKDYHLFGHGTGAALALQRVKAQSSNFNNGAGGGAGIGRVVSLTLASPILSSGRTPPKQVSPGFPNKSDYVLQALEQYPSRQKKIPICFEEAAQKQTFIDVRFNTAARAAEPGVASSVSVPTLVTLGADDTLLNQADIDALLKYLPADSTTVTTLTGCGHMPHLDDRETYIKLLQDFYGTVDASLAKS